MGKMFKTISKQMVMPQSRRHFGKLMKQIEGFGGSKSLGLTPDFNLLNYSHLKG